MLGEVPTLGVAEGAGEVHFRIPVIRIEQNDVRVRIGTLAP